MRSGECGGVAGSDEFNELTEAEGDNSGRDSSRDWGEKDDEEEAASDPERCVPDLSALGHGEPCSSCTCRNKRVKMSPESEKDSIYAQLTR